MNKQKTIPIRHRKQLGPAALVLFAVFFYGTSQYWLVNILIGVQRTTGICDFTVKPQVSSGVFLDRFSI